MQDIKDNYYFAVLKLAHTKQSNYACMVGALDKLKSKGLIEFKRVYRQMNQFQKLGRKIVKIKGPQKTLMRTKLRKKASVVMVSTP